MVEVTDYKPIINEMPYGFEIPGKVSSTFFRVHDIRSSDAEAFKMLYRKYVSKKDPVPFVDNVDENDRFYIVPFYANTIFKTNYIVALDKNLNFYRLGELDPYPFNFSKVSSSNKVYIAPDWQTYFDFMQTHLNVVLNFSECCIVIDKFVKKDKWWLETLRSKPSVSLLKSLSKDNQKLVEDLLTKEKVNFSLDTNYNPVKVKPVEVPTVKPKTKKVSQAKPVLEDVFLDRANLVKYLASKGVKISYDTLQKVTRFFPVPKEGDCYSSLFIRLYVKAKTSKNTRQEAFEKALKEYDNAID
jgi:hypothetical protein